PTVSLLVEQAGKPVAHQRQARCLPHSLSAGGTGRKACCPSEAGKMPAPQAISLLVEQASCLSIKILHQA
ncbi:hypothetical protein, partial [Microcoleus sp. B7-D4]|uniref:hypothetical protein n=1 Tax=Microcoleus sp. B7-D4 TaxID=2818696 RepID=UPI002FD6D920